MKTNKFYGILSFFMIAFAITSCVQDGDFSLPNTETIEPNITPNSSIKAVKDALKQEFTSNAKLVYTFREEEKPEDILYLEGYVVSTDATGNFFKTLVIQDKIENPTVGIEIQLNQTSLNQTFDFGRKVYVKLNGLSVSYDDGGRTIDPTNDVVGKYVLGVLDGDRVDDIPSTDVKKHIFRSGTREDIVPTKLKIAEIAEGNIHTFVQLEAAQFEKSLIGQTFSGGADDSFDGFRTIFECETEQTITLQTSTFASFKSNILPAGKGAISLVLSKDFRSEFLVGIVNRPSDIAFTSDDRCDPAVVECSGTSGGGSTSVFSENFTGFGSFTAEGWNNENIDGTDTDWFIGSFSNNNYAQISAFRSGNANANVWLVTPAFTMDATTAEELSFDIQANYDNGTNLSVFISTDYVDDPETATWQRLEATVPSGPGNSFGSFQTVGPINISCIDGASVRIGFFYAGSDPTATTRYHLDNIKVTGK